MTSLYLVVGVAVHETSEHISLTFGYSANGDINKTKGPRAPNAIRAVDQHWAVVRQGLVHLAKGHREMGRRAENRQAVMTVHGTLPQYSNSVCIMYIIQYVCKVIVLEGENLTDKHYTTNKMVITFSCTVPYLCVRTYVHTHVSMSLSYRRNSRSGLGVAGAPKLDHVR